MATKKSTKSAPKTAATKRTTSKKSAAPTVATHKLTMLRSGEPVKSVEIDPSEDPQEALASNVETAVEKKGMTIKSQSPSRAVLLHDGAEVVIFVEKINGSGASKKATAKKAGASAKSAKGTTAKKAGGSAGRKSAFADDAKITVVSKENPKRPGSKAHGVFKKYKNGMTVAQALAAGVTTAHLRWDSSHGFIKVTGGAKSSKAA